MVNKKKKKKKRGVLFGGSSFCATFRVFKGVSAATMVSCRLYTFL